MKCCEGQSSAGNAAEVYIAAGGAGDRRAGVPQTHLAHALHVLIQEAGDQGALGEDDLPGKDVPGRHHPPALPLELRDHNGDAVPGVPGPVLPLTLSPAVGDGVTPGALRQLLLPSHGLVTLETNLPVCHWLDEVLRHYLMLFEYLQGREEKTLGLS